MVKELTDSQSQRIRGRSNPPNEPDAIHCTVELIQSRKTGVMEDDEPGQKPAVGGKTFDIFTGDKSGDLPLARITSSASSLENPALPKNTGVFGRISKPASRKSVIPEGP